MGIVGSKIYATMPKNSAGIILYRLLNGFPEVLLVHPGGPFWFKKDTGAWSIPKGEIDDGEERLDTAKREFEEETGNKISGKFFEMKPVKLKSGKIVFSFAVEGDMDISSFRSNTFMLEWPPKSGKMIEIPEVDSAAWFNIPTARKKINTAQIGILDELINVVNNTTDD